MSDDQDQSRQHWSSTFVRNRTEVVSLATLIFVATRLGLDFKKVPVLGIELTHDAPRGIILIGMYAFFLYFVACWWLRFRVEIQSSGLPRDYLSKSLADVTAELNGVAHVALPDWGLKLHGLADSWNDATFRFSESYRDTYKPDVQKWFLREANTRAGVELSQQLDSFLKELPLYEARLLQARSALTEAIDEMADQGRQALMAYQTETIGTLEAFGPRIEKSLISIRDHISNLTADLSRFRQALAWDKIVFGFWIPLLAAILLAGVSLPQAWRDAKPAIGNIQDCVLNDLHPCLYRSE